MGKEVIETIYGKRDVYHVISESSLFGRRFCVRNGDGRLLAEFDRLDRAVAWARRKAEA